MNTMEALFALLSLLGMGYALFRGFKWMLQTGSVQARKEQPLTPNDLKVLEESAARLMADLRATTEECVARIESACAEAEQVLGKLQSVENVAPSRSADYVAAPIREIEQITDEELVSDTAPSVLRLIDAELSPAQIARQAGMTTGEIQLLQSLRDLEAAK